MRSYQQKIIMYVSEKSVMVSFWIGQQYQSHQCLAHDEMAYAVFSQYLSQYKKARLYLLVDAMEEEYQLAVLPQVSGAAGRAMLARKLSQFSRNSAYKTACLLRRETTSRKEDIFVLLALTNPYFLQQWMDIIQTEQALLVGVYALPVLHKVMADQLTIASSPVLICEHLSSGLRQTYLQDGGLRISRLTAMDCPPTMQWVDFYLAEIEKMRLYLLSQRMLSDEASLQVVLFDLDAVSKDVAKGLKQRGMMSKIANRQDAFKKSNLKQSDLKAYPVLHYIQLLSRLVIPANLASPEMTEVYRIKQLSSRAYLLVMMLVVMGLLVVIGFYSQSMKKEVQINFLNTQTNALLKQYALVANHTSTTAISGEDLKAVVSTAQMVSKPLPLMPVISTALEAVPEVSISRIRWVQSDQDAVMDEGGAVSIAEAKASNGKWLQVGFINANISDFAGDYQKALASANRFVANLRADNRVMAVQVIQAPIKASLYGNTNEVQTTEFVPIAFKLKVILH